MDKRTLLFFISLSVTLFFVNYLFTRWDADKNEEWYAQQARKKEIQLSRLENELVQRTAPVSSLPLTEVYKNVEGTEHLSTGILDEDHLLLLSSASEIPNKVYARKIGSDQKLESFVLVTPKPEEAELAIYKKEGTSQPLEVRALPEKGSYDVQLIFASNQEPSFSEVTLGEYRDGFISMPIAKLVKEQPQKYGSKLPKGSAIALFQTNRTYVPVGVYHAEHQSFVPFRSMESLKGNIKIADAMPVATPKTGKEEMYYVLENPYQQLVFSNIGGALTEINLPFQSEKNPKSVVLEIDFDREMVQKHPQNAHFPSHPYYSPGEKPDGEFEKHNLGVLGGYYPLLRRDLIEKNAKKTVRIKPPYYAFNIVSEYPEVAELVYQVTHFDKESITFEAKQPHRRITKTFKIANDGAQAPYTLDLTIKIEGDSRGLWLTTGVPEVEWLSGSIAPALKYRITRHNKAEVENLSLPQESLTVSSVTPDWVCNSNGFLGMILDPLSEVDSGYKALFIPGNLVPSRLLEIDQEYQKFKAVDMPGYAMMLPLKSTGGTMQFRIFAGPFSEGILKKVDSIYADPATGYNPDYIACQSFHGWFAFISEPFAKFLMILMNIFHQFTGSWALSIVLLTVALRLLLYPLNAWSMKSMIRMQEIAPEVTALQEKYKKNPKQLQLEIANLYRSKGVNPVSGCFPLLIQMPFLIGMFDLLKSTFELRGASFIPGWIDNLAAPDVLFRWNYPIFFIGNEFHLLPILLGVVMYLQSRMSSNAPRDVKLMTDQQRQQRVMGNMMTVLFAVMFYNVPSGLNIYWLSSMLLGILQQWWTARSLKAKKVLRTES